MGSETDDIAAGSKGWRRRARLALVALAFLILSLFGIRQYLSAADARHARFFELGSSINGLLGDYCARWKQSVEGQDPAPLLELYSPDLQAAGAAPRYLAAAELVGGAEVRAWESEEGAERAAAQLPEILSTGLSEIAGVDHAQCKIGLMEEHDSPGEARLTVHLGLLGRDASGERLRDRRKLRWSLVREGDPGLGQGWRIAEESLVDGARSRSREESFLAVQAADLGIDFQHRRDPHLADGAATLFDLSQHMGSGLSAADYDGDGRPDLFFADGVRSRLYRNLGPGADGLPRFADTTDALGAAPLDRAMTGLWGDLDNDGDQDLVVLRFLAPAVLLINDGAGAWQDRSAGSGLGDGGPAVSASLLDADGDGLLDLYVGHYGDPFAAVPRLPFYARNGRPNRLYRNLGGGRFEEIGEAAGVDDTGWSLATAAADLDDDGDIDLVVANDFGRKSLFLNRGDGRFDERAKEAGVLDFSGGMGVAVGDYDADGLLDLYTSNIQSNQRWYGEDLTVKQFAHNLLRTHWFWKDLGEMWAVYRLIDGDLGRLGSEVGEGNSLFHNAGDGRFEERRRDAAHRAGWGWGVALFDHDRDGDLDLYAANGFISNKPGTDL